MKATGIVGEVRNILRDDEMKLEVCEIIHTEHDSDLLQKIIVDLKETMRANGCRYLTAPQIGEDYNVFCIRFGENDVRTFVNSMVKNVMHHHFSIEECLSIPGKRYLVQRCGTIVIECQTPLGESTEQTFYGEAAELIEHCIWHIDGNLISMIGLEIDELWYQATDEEREEVMEAYKNALDEAAKIATQELKDDPELAQLNEAIEFMNSVRDGKTKLEVIEDKSE